MSNNEKLINLGNLTKYDELIKVYISQQVAEDGVQYLGVVDNREELDAIVDMGQGDYVRVGTAFENAHAGDLFIYDTDTWVLIHCHNDSNTTYELTKSGNTITLIDSNNQKTSVTDSDTTYTADPESAITLTGTTFGTDLIKKGSGETSLVLLSEDGTEVIAIQSDGTATVTQDPSADMGIATKNYVDANKVQIVTTEGTGSAYTATVPGITELTPGVSFVMIPHVVSTSTTPTLNVNSLGAIELRRLYSQSTTSYAGGYTQAWLKINIPTTVMYDGKYWIAKDLVKPNAYDLYGNVPVYHGGTGKATHTANSILTGNGGNEVNNVPTKSGALFATGDGVAATFDTLPIAQGGTGATTEADVVTNLKSPLIDLIFPVGSFFVTSADSGLDPNNLFGGHWIGYQYNRTYTVAGTGVFTIASNPFPIFMLSDILTMFQNTYGSAVIPSVGQYNMSISIGNGDGIANGGGVSYVWRNDVLCVKHSMSNGAARFNYAFSIVQPEPIIHWYRVI